ncbi:hypothetical protein Clacol_010512 [Clathrus columnatus]|uniref:F-box domain-containing protein n=1 Tax=Clathrus columnatus TaxID=1419009 RepID=A0AAV5ANI7_9AGAM|nr:hypothetical protein Clacol_010512 [Clathrus columnatus]
MTTLSKTPTTTDRISFIPSELLGVIIDLIDEPKDLLQLALASKHFYTIVVSDHLYYRHIRCDSRYMDLWSLFQTNFSIASKIRKLEMVTYTGRARNFLIPPSFRKKTYGDGGDLVVSDDNHVLQVLREAIGNMKNLHLFSWSEQKSRSWEGMLELFKTLVARCTNIQELEIMNANSSEPSNPTFTLDRALDPVSLPLEHHVETHPPNNPPYFDKLLQMIIFRCKRLKDLYIRSTFGLLNVSVLFLEGHWPDLRRFGLGGHISLFPEEVNEATQSSRMISFWKLHPNLECVLLIPATPFITIESGTLPLLRSFSCPIVSEFSVTIPTDVLSHVKHLFIFTQLNNNVGRIRSILRSAMSLTSLVIIHWSGWDLLSVIPTIQRFACFNEDVILPADGRSRSVLDMMTSLPHLTHLGGISFEYAEESLVVPELFRFPKLKYVEGLQGRKWTELKRDAEGKVVQLHTIERNIQDLNWEDWGGDFWGIGVRYSYI